MTAMCAHGRAILIAMAFAFLGIIYGVVTPIFESPDELWHYPYVWHVARTGNLPVLKAGIDQPWAHEGGQAPLYYLCAALLTWPIRTDDLESLLYHNPHAAIGEVTPDRNVNITVHTSREQFPWHGAVLAIHVVRLFSTALATGTVLTTYALGRVLWPERESFALLAMGLVAFTPMFPFIAGSVTNDNMITLTASLTLWQLVSLLLDESKEPPVWRFVVVASLAGLAALSKLSGLGIVGLVALALLLNGIRRRSWRMALGGSFLAIALPLIIAGWWYWRNQLLYGDWTGTQPILAMMAPRDSMPNLSQWLLEASGLSRSFVGVFGYFSVLMPQAVYWVMYALLALGGLGLFAGLLPTRSERLPPRLRKVWPVLVAWIGLVIGELLWYTLSLDFAHFQPNRE